MLKLTAIKLRYLAVKFGRRIGLSQPGIFSNILETRSWIRRRYGPPSPNFIKRAVLIRNSIPECTWIETGTYRGDTTKKLAKIARCVLSIEPDPVLYAKARFKLRRLSNVKLFQGLSEEILPEILPGIAGRVCFWLDGHFSGGVTFKGPQDTPVRDELSTIAKFIPKFDQVAVLVDDVRMFGDADFDSTYPSINSLVTWATSNRLEWKVEHDIFVAYSATSKRPR